VARIVDLPKHVVESAKRIAQIENSSEYWAWDDIFVFEHSGAFYRTRSVWIASAFGRKWDGEDYPNQKDTVRCAVVVPRAVVTIEYDDAPGEEGADGSSLR
jgi:hypothetical protein